jgi:hypothetical protein
MRKLGNSLFTRALALFIGWVVVVFATGVPVYAHTCLKSGETEVQLGIDPLRKPSHTPTQACLENDCCLAQQFFFELDADYHTEHTPTVAAPALVGFIVPFSGFQAPLVALARPLGICNKAPPLESGMTLGQLYSCWRI